MTFYDLLEQVLTLLQQHHRLSYRGLKLQFPLLDPACLDALRDELLFQGVARDAEGQGLIWLGRTSEVPQATVSRQPVPVGSTIEPSRATPTVSAALPAPATGDDELTVPTSGLAAPEAERQQLTVLFCDLVGSTQLSGQLDPEDWRAVVRAYQETAAAVIQHYEGYIAQYLGDGLLVYFGYPTAHEDEARRAVHTGLGIVEAVTTLNARLAAQYGIQLAVRLGIHTGPVVVGVMGSGGRYEHLALGETPNVAARLQGLAPANAVVISVVTARLAQGIFALEDLGMHTLHGVAEPMWVSRVHGLLALPSPDEGWVTATAPVLVGRDEESGLLRRRWEQSKAGLGQVVLLSGEAGIGKSTLAEALQAQVRTEGLPRIIYRCSPYHTTSALYPIITHLEHLLRFAPDDPVASKLHKLETGLQPYDLPLAEVVPLLAGLLSVPLPEDRYAGLTLTPQQQKQQTFDVLLAWMVAEGERQPVLVAWEDLHWADPTTMEFLGLMVEQAPTVPMLHVLTYRPEFHPPWPQRSHITPLVLNRLEHPQVEALIRQRARGKTLPAEVVQHIVAKTDGVPLYVEELTKMLLASPLLRQEADQYVLTGPLRTVAIPETLQDALMARLDQLETAKEVAQLGAVLGREFPYDLLQAIAPQDENTLQEGLAQLVAAELLYQRGRPPRATYIFKHALIQDVAYASLLRRTRQQIHQQLAQSLEARFPVLVETRPELVAQHYTAAGCTAQAVHYWQRAGQHASERSANVEASSHLTRGLALLKALPDTIERAWQELELQIALGPALMAIKGWGVPEVEQAYSRARELCRQVGETPRLFPVLWGLWGFYQMRGELWMAQEVGEQLFDLAQSAHEQTLLLLAHNVLGDNAIWLGEFTSAREHIEQGMALYNAQRHHSLALRYGGFDPGLHSRYHAAFALWALGYPAQALERRHDTLTLARELSHPHSRASAAAHVAMFHSLRREWQAAQELAEAGMALSSEYGFPLWFAWGTIHRGWALAEQGQREEGLAQMRHGLAAWRATGTELIRPYFLGLLAEAYRQGGQAEEGLGAIDEALALVQKHKETFCEAELYRLKGELLLSLAAGNEAEAEACFHHALDIARRQSARSWELRATMSLSRLLQRQGKQEAAHQRLAEIYSWFTEGFDTADLQEAQELLKALSDAPVQG